MLLVCVFPPMLRAYILQACFLQTTIRISHLSCPFLSPCRSSYSSLLLYNISFMSPSSVSLLISSVPLRVFHRKTHPAPSARLFGAMRRLELWY